MKNRKRVCSHSPFRCNKNTMVYWCIHAKPLRMTVIAKLKVWYNRSTQSNSDKPQWERRAYYGERDIKKRGESVITSVREKRRGTQGKHMNESVTNVETCIYNPVALLKINKLGVLGGNGARTSGVDNARRAFLS